MIDIPDITLTYAVSIALCVLGFAGMVIVRVVPMGQAGRYVDPFGVILMCMGLLVVLYGAFWQIPQIENRIEYAYGVQQVECQFRDRCVFRAPSFRAGVIGVGFGFGCIV